MAKKFDYQKNVITIDEAMEMLGFSNVDKFVSIVDKHIPSHKIDRSEEHTSTPVTY